MRRVFLPLGERARGLYPVSMRNDIERVLIDEKVIEKRLDSMALEIGLWW